MSRASRTVEQPSQSQGSVQELKIQVWPLDTLTPYARNARTHSDEQIAQIAASIREFGFVNPILAGPDRVVIAGHARLLAARKLGLSEAPVIVIDALNENQRRALALADNRLPLNAGWDEEMLRLEIEALRDAEYDLDLIGFDDDELRSLLAQQESAGGLTDDDAVPDIPTQPVSTAGARLQQATGAAVSTPLKIMVDANAPASVRVGAPDSVLDHSKQAIEIEDMEVRLAALEQAAERQQPDADARAFGDTVRLQRAS